MKAPGAWFRMASPRPQKGFANCETEQLDGVDPACTAFGFCAILGMGWQGSIMRECVAAIIVQQQMILLGQRSPERAFYPNVWDVFGGHVEPHEAYEQALQRELLEELGITPTRWDYLTTLAEPDPDQHGQGRYHFYLVTAWRGTPSNQQPHEHVQIQWFALDQMMHIELAHPAYARLFAQFVSGMENSDKGDQEP